MNLFELSNTPDNRRDEAWEDLFLTALTDNNVYLMSQDPQTGPDSWPYLLVSTDPVENQKPEPAQKIIQWLAERGIGLAVNPQKEFPDYVLTYGMLWSFRETGKFIHRKELQSKPDSGRVDFAIKDLKNIGAPTLSYLPEKPRKILREFFRDQGVLQPKICVISMDDKSFDLAFSLESLGNPPESEWSGIGEAISWFLPPHYSIVLLSEKGLQGFEAL
jgi:hypothetical protein